MYKRVFITYKQDYIRIFTGYRTESWIFIGSFPVYVLDLDTEESKIKECVIECFQHSREISKKEEDEVYYLGNKMLKLLKEKSWKSSYNANYCKIKYNTKDGFSLSFSKLNKKTKAIETVKEISLNITSIEEINIGEILSVLKSL